MVMENDAWKILKSLHSECNNIISEIVSCMAPSVFFKITSHGIIPEELVAWFIYELYASEQEDLSLIHSLENIIFMNTKSGVMAVRLIFNQNKTRIVEVDLKNCSLGI